MATRSMAGNQSLAMEDAPAAAQAMADHGGLVTDIALTRG